jgi:hypothetical protein
VIITEPVSKKHCVAKPPQVPTSLQRRRDHANPTATSFIEEKLRARIRVNGHADSSSNLALVISTLVARFSQLQQFTVE